MFVPIFGLILSLVITSVEPLQEIRIDSATVVPTYGYARDAQYEYLATPQGLYRAPRLASSTPELIGFGGEAVHAVGVSDSGALYVAKGTGNEAGTSAGHTLVKSVDHGASFINIDAALLDCSLQTCAYLVPTRLGFGPDRLYTNAGGNVLVSDDDGASWHQLYGLPSNGKPAAQVCPVKFERAGTTMFLGGECPLDVAWLDRGTLSDDLLAWDAQPKPVVTPNLENRNVQFIRVLEDGVVYAGIEGALLKSTDGGASFRFVMHYHLEAVDRYPYIGHMLVSSRDPRLMLVGGFDKKNAVGFLAVSADAGETWQDISHFVGEPYVSLLVEDADGRILIGLQYPGKFVLAEVRLADWQKRRAVR